MNLEKRLGYRTASNATGNDNVTAITAAALELHRLFQT